MEIVDEDCFVTTRNSNSVSLLYTSFSEINLILPRSPWWLERLESGSRMAISRLKTTKSGWKLIVIHFPYCLQTPSLQESFDISAENNGKSLKRRMIKFTNGTVCLSRDIISQYLLHRSYYGTDYRGRHLSPTVAVKISLQGQPREYGTEASTMYSCIWHSSFHYTPKVSGQ